MSSTTPVLLGLFLTSFLFAQKYTEIQDLGPVPRYKICRTKDQIGIDGKLSEKAWAKAIPVTLVFPWDTQTGKKQKTSIRLLYDKANLYVGYDCEDSDITAVYEKRDDPTFMDDCVEIFIRPKDASLHYVGLEMNAKGALLDYFFPFPNELDRSLSLAGVQLKTTLRGTLNQRNDQDQGWSLEFAIPFQNFSPYALHTPPKPGDIWRIQLNRWDGTEDSGGRRLSMWCHSGLKNPHPHNPERFGIVEFK
jgi:hypothetical protein